MSENINEKEKILEFAKRYLALEWEIKQIKLDQKQLKQEMKDDGVPVGLVLKAVSELKKELKEDKSPEKVEIEMYKKMIEESNDILNQIESLI